MATNTMGFALYCRNCKKKVDVFHKDVEKAKVCPSCDHEFSEEELKEAMEKSKMFKKK